LDVNYRIPCEEAGLLLLLIFSLASRADPRIEELPGAINGDTLEEFFSVK